MHRAESFFIALNAMKDVGEGFNTIVKLGDTLAGSGRSGGISEAVMSGSREDRIAAELWSLPQAAEWIETRADGLRSSIEPTTVRELHEALKGGTIAASGCVDGGERRAISSAEWHDYRLKLEHKTFFGGPSELPVITVLSNRSFPAGALKYHGYKSGVQIPSAQSSAGEPGYNRVIDDVRILRKEVVKSWPPFGSAPSPPPPKARIGPNLKVCVAQSMRSIPVASQTKRQNRILSCANVLARSLRPLACPRFRMTPF